MNQKKVLIASSAPEAYKDLFPKPEYAPPVLAGSAAAAKQRLMKESFSMIVVGTPLPDESLHQCACEIAAAYEQNVLLFVPTESLDQIQYQCSEHSVFVLPVPLNRQMAGQVISFLDKVTRQNQRLQHALARQKQKMEDEKMIFRCKLKLIEHYRWTEEKAHSYITKTAMDHSTTKVHIARILMSKMEG